MDAAKPHLIRQVNQDTIRSLISSHGPITKPEIARLTDLSIPTVNKIVDTLESNGIICRVENRTRSIGRRAQSYVIRKDSMKAIIIVCQDGQFCSCITNLAGEVIAEKLTPVKKGKGHGSYATMTEVIDSYFEICERTEIKAIVVGIAGVINPDGSVCSIPSFPDLEDFDITSELEGKYQLPIFVENDVKLMAVGYFHTESNNAYEDMSFLYIGTGIASGTILNGKLMTGCRHFAGELGYMTISESDKDSEPVGPEGSLERYLLPQVDRLKNEEEVDPELFQNYCKTIARVITNFVSIMNPEVMVVRGPKLKKEDAGMISSFLKNYVPNAYIPQLNVVESDRYGLLGAIQFYLANTMSTMTLINKQGV